MRRSANYKYSKPGRFRTIPNKTRRTINTITVIDCPLVNFCVPILIYLKIRLKAKIRKTGVKTKRAAL